MSARWQFLHDLAEFDVERRRRRDMHRPLSPEEQEAMRVQFTTPHVSPVAEPDYPRVARSARRSILAFYVASIPFWVLVGFAIGWAAR